MVDGGRVDGGGGDGGAPHGGPGGPSPYGYAPGPPRPYAPHQPVTGAYAQAFAASPTGQLPRTGGEGRFGPGVPGPGTSGFGTPGTPGRPGTPGTPDPGGRSGRRRRRLLVAAAATVAVAGAAAGSVAVLASRGNGPARPGTAAPQPGGTAATSPSASTSASGPADVPPLMGWLSGASSDEAADGRVDRWRSTPIAIGGTWDNGNAQQLAMQTICPGGPWAAWNRPLDVAVGAIDVGRGETWAAAARGAYTARWTKHLQRMKQCWGSRDPGLLYIRFAHEMNLEGSTWRVRGGEEASFAKAITLYSNLRYQILPKAKIVLCPNDGTQVQGLGGLDIRKLWPGKDDQGRPVADVYAVDSYNMNPHVNTVADFTKKINEQYGNGMPLGIEKHRQQAQRWGVPFAIGEWSNSGDPHNGGGGGESPLYVQQFFAWARSHAGDVNHPRPGQLLYEVQFNLWDQYAFWPKTQQPRTAAAYRALPWGKP